MNSCFLRGWALYPNLAFPNDQEWTDDERAGSCDQCDQKRVQDRHSTGGTAQRELKQRVDTRTPQKMGSASANATWTSDGVTRQDESSENEVRDDQARIRRFPGRDTAS